MLTVEQESQLKDAKNIIMLEIILQMMVKFGSLSYTLGSPTLDAEHTQKILYKMCIWLSTMLQWQRVNNAAATHSSTYFYLFTF